MTTLVAVYGSLKRGQSNHHFLAAAEYRGTARLEGFALYDLGPWPGAKREPGVVQVEVFAVDAQTFAALDELEDYCAHAPEHGIYDRVEVETDHGRAWIYLYNLHVQPEQREETGCWG